MCCLAWVMTTVQRSRSNTAWSWAPIISGLITTQQLFTWLPETLIELCSTLDGCIQPVRGFGYRCAFFVMRILPADRWLRPERVTKTRMRILSAGLSRLCFQTIMAQSLIMLICSSWPENTTGSASSCCLCWIFSPSARVWGLLAQALMMSGPWPCWVKPTKPWKRWQKRLLQDGA